MAARGRSQADERLAAELAGGATVAAAAAAAGVSERTAYRRLGDDAFRRRVAELRGAMVDRAVGSLAKAAGYAVAKLRELLESPQAAVQLRAARAILAELVRLRSAAELEQRIAELEARLDRPHQPHPPPAAGCRGESTPLANAPL